MSVSVRTVVVTLAAASLGMAVGCSDGASPSPSAPSAPLNTSVTLAPGQSVTLQGTGTVLTFQAVTEDSRCPASAMCVTSGQAVVALGLLIGGDAIQPFSLATAPDRQRQRLGDLEFRLERVTPYPMMFPIDIPASAYRAEVRVVRP